MQRSQLRREKPRAARAVARRRHIPIVGPLQHECSRVRAALPRFAWRLEVVRLVVQVYRDLVAAEPRVEQEEEEALVCAAT